MCSIVMYVFEDHERSLKCSSKAEAPICVMFPDRIMLIWTGRLKDFDNTKEQIADILTKDSCAISRWTHLMQLVHINATPSDEASALLISGLPKVSEKGKSAEAQASV